MGHLPQLCSAVLCKHTCGWSANKSRLYCPTDFCRTTHPQRNPTAGESLYCGLRQPVRNRLADSLLLYPSCTQKNTQHAHTRTHTDTHMHAQNKPFSPQRWGFLHLVGCWRDEVDGGMPRRPTTYLLMPKFTRSTRISACSIKSLVLIVA